ncbi:MAG: polysaccharide biosynthesis C-terminal domain-containing protein, partial [Acidobacteriota bacterium]
ERYVRNNLLFTAIINITLNVTLVPLFGVMGAAIATAISFASKNLIAVYLVRLRLGIMTIPVDWLPLWMFGKTTEKNM